MKNFSHCDDSDEEEVTSHIEQVASNGTRILIEERRDEHQDLNEYESSSAYEHRQSQKRDRISESSVSDLLQLPTNTTFFPLRTTRLHTRIHRSEEDALKGQRIENADK